jgi:signal transduction histidine kinase
VKLTVRGRCFVHGSAELLRSAIENVIRNAVRYTTPDASVDIHWSAWKSRTVPSSYCLYAITVWEFLNQSFQIFLDRFIA